MTPIRYLLLAVLLALTSACSNVSIKPQGGSKIATAPSHEERKPFYLGGLIGEHQVDVNVICEGANVLQMQTIVTPSDYALGLVTLFIYSPRTARVWCEA